MLGAARRRYLDVLASIYIYNEHRGYTSIDRVLAAVRENFPDEASFIALIEKHRRDERQHYLMFRHYFERQDRKPFLVDRTVGHIDRFIRIMFGCGIDELETDRVIHDPELFFRLCRVIMLTEMCGMRQVEILLRSPLIRSERALIKIFRVIERDEPDHWRPYQFWLEKKSARMPGLGERLADGWVHRSLMLVKFPLLYLNPFLRRRTDWYDESETEADRAIPPGTDVPATPAGNAPVGLQRPDQELVA